MTHGKYPAHPAADVFPEITGVAFEELCNDIAENGLREPIVRVQVDGAWFVLDGRNRLRACIKARVEPIWKDYGGKDYAAFVVSANLRRRHLDETQRAMAAAKLATLPRGNPNLPNGRIGCSTATAAKLLNVSVRSAGRGKRVRAKGTPEVVQAAERGDLPLRSAEKIAALPKDKQADSIAAETGKRRTGAKPSKPAAVSGTASASAPTVKPNKSARAVAVKVQSALPASSRQLAIVVDHPPVAGKALPSHAPTIVIDDDDDATPDPLIQLARLGAYIQTLLDGWGNEEDLFVTNLESWVKRARSHFEERGRPVDDADGDEHHPLVLMAGLASHVQRLILKWDPAWNKDTLFSLLGRLEPEARRYLKNKQESAGLGIFPPPLAADLIWFGDKWRESKNTSNTKKET